MENKLSNHNTPTEQNHIAFSHRALTLFTFIVIAFSTSSCTQKQQNDEKELNVVERIGVEISLYKFHHEYGTARMGEVISAAEELLEAIRNPQIQLSEEQIELDLH